jgi:hypothetical protein
MAAAAPPMPLLTETQLRAFVTDGVLILPLASVPPRVHARVRELMCGPLLNFAEGMPGMMSPGGRGKIAEALKEEFEQIWGSAEVTAALNSVLGPDAWSDAPDHAPGHPHYKLSTIIGQAYHKDNYGHQPREHTPAGALLMYYPQTVTMEMGPTKVLPGCVYLENNRENEVRGEDHLGPKWHLQYQDYPGRSRVEVNEFWHVAEEVGGPQRVDKEYESSLGEIGSGPARWVEPLVATVPEGSVVFMHQHAYHRATFSAAGIEAQPRFGFKRNFVRMAAPTSSSPLAYLPDGGGGDGVFDDAETRLTPALRPVWEHIWKNFYHPGLSAAAAATATSATAEAVSDSAAALSATNEEDDRIGAAYSLAARVRTGGSTAVAAGALAALRRALVKGNDESVQRAGYRGLAAAGVAAVPSLIEALGHSQPNVRVYACFALGDAVEPGCARAVAVAAVGALAERLADGGEEHPRVLCQACKALGKMYSSLTSESASAGSGDDDARGVIVRLLGSVLSSPRVPAEDIAAIVSRYAKAYPDEPLLQPGESNQQELMTWFGRCGAFKNRKRSDRSPEWSNWEIEFPDWLGQVRWEVEYSGWFGGIGAAARHSLLQCVLAEAKEARTHSLSAELKALAVEHLSESTLARVLALGAKAATAAASPEREEQSSSRL